MNSNSVLVFYHDGTGHGLYTEQIDLASIGTLEMRRASTIEFDANRQQWIVEIYGDEVFAHPSRRTCLQWEHQFFNA